MEDIRFFFEEYSFVVSVISTMLSLFVGAFLTNHFFKIRAKNSLTFDFHSEFSSNEFSKYRRQANLFIKKNPTSSYKELGKKDENDSIALFTIMRFYQRLWIAIKYKKVKKKMAQELFEENFLYWYFASFKPNLIDSTDWEIRNDIDDFYKWISTRIDKDKFNRFKNRVLDASKTEENNQNDSEQRL